MKINLRLKLIFIRIIKHDLSQRNLKINSIAYWTNVFKLEVLRKIKLKRQFRIYGMVSTNIETVSACNRTCEFCFNNPVFKQREQGRMPVCTWKSIIDQLSIFNFCGRISPHFYNEPLLDNRLEELLAYARKKLPLSWIQINSNGDLLNEERFLKLIEAGTNYFFVTNYDDYDKPDLQKLQKKYPAFIKIVRNCDMWRTDRGGEIFKKNKVLFSPCLRPLSQLVINWEGKVLLCCMDYYAKYCFGSLLQKKLMSIWFDPKFVNCREILKVSRQGAMEICKNCDDPGFIPW
jgi:GTP 3',8-cyclase